MLKIINLLNYKILTLFFFIICLFHISLFPYNINDSVDFSSYYYPAGQNIANGLPPEGLNAELKYRYPPGFPILISIVIMISNMLYIDFSIAMFIFSAICIYISSMIVYKISQEFFSDKLSIIVSFLMLTYPLVIWTLRQPNSEDPFMLFFFLSVFLYIRSLKRNSENYLLYFLCGLTLGFSMLIRPIAIAIPFIFISFLFYYNYKYYNLLKKSFITSLIFILGLSTTIVPWEYHVYNREKKIILLSSSGAAALYDGLTFNVNLKNYRIKKNLPEDIDDLMINLNKNLSINSSFSEIVNELKKEFSIRPLTVIKLYIYKFLKSFYGTDTQKHENMIIIFQIFYFYFIIKSLYLSIKSSRMNNFDILFIILALYFSFMTTISLSIVRYTFPATCLLFICIPVYLEKRGLNVEPDKR